MRTRATDNGVADGWRGARIGAVIRDTERRDARRIPARIDVGEPGVPRATVAFLALTLAATLLEFATYGVSPSGIEAARAGGSSLGAIATGEWWKLVVANLLHGSLVHVASNAFVLYLVGRWLEHVVGPLVVAAVICWSALLSSVVAILLSSGAPTVGASGVAFGLVGCALAIDPRAHTAVGVIARQLAVVNVIFTFAVPNVSIGGHLGGLLAGLAVGWCCWSRSVPEEPDRSLGSIGRSHHRRSTVLVAASVPVLLVLLAGPRVLPSSVADARSHVVAPLLAREIAGAELTGGVTVDRASCAPGATPLRYACVIDGESVEVVYARRDDRWSFRSATLG